MLEACGLQAGYSDHVVIENFSARFEPGKLYVVLGKNGSGKSTLLQALGGWMPLKKGSVRLDGVILSSLSSQQLACCTGRIAEGLHSVPLSVLRFVQLGNYCRQTRFGLFKGLDQTAVFEALQQMGIESLAQRQLSEISAGQRQKAAIAQILVQNPACIFLDEPSSALDPQARFELMELLKTLKTQERILIIVVHDLDLALRCGDEILVLEGGSLVFQGSPDQFVFSKTPQDVFGLRIEDWDPASRTGRFFARNSSGLVPVKPCRAG